jgi:hypothetical protein
MSLNNGINVRLDPEIRLRLEALAQRYGVKSSVLIRQAIMEKLTDIETRASVVITASGSSNVATTGGKIATVGAPAKKQTKRKK